MSRRTSEACPACGRLIEVEQIEVTTWARGWDNPEYIDGRAFCPSGCDPRFRRIVVARDHRGFELVCRDHGWNPRRVIYVSAVDRQRGVEALRGLAVRPEMVSIVSEPHPEIVQALRMGIARGDGDVRTLPFPPVPSSSCEADRPYIADPALWDAAVTEDPAPDFSADRMAQAIDEAIRHNARILERHRTEEDPFYWNDSMQWTAGQQEAS